MIIAGVGITKEALADLMGISDRTLRNRPKQPSEFRQAELRIVDWLSEKHKLGV